MNIPTARSFTRPFGKLAGSITFGVLSICFASLSTVQGGFVQTNLVSDIPGLAANTDPNLKNPWGIASSTTSPFCVSDHGTGVSTLSDSNGVPQPLVPQPLVVTIPPAPGGLTG